jgi:hypothetical protein
MAAPQEDKLEEFYIALGASPLSSLVQDDLRLGSHTVNQKPALKLRDHVLERSKLFLHEASRENIKHDSRWLEKNLTLEIVSSITVRRSLRGHTVSHTMKKSATTTHERHKGWTLFVTEEYNDTYQISLSLCSLLLERPTQQSFLTFETFLNLNLYQLRARGYNVDRILRAKKAEQRIAEEERRRQLEAEQAQIRQQEEQWKQQGMAAEASAREDRRQSKEVSMPGAFGFDSPENSPEPVRQGRKGLFSGLTRRLGLDNANGEAQQQLQNFLGGGSGSHSHEEPPQRQLDNPPNYHEANPGSVARGGKGTEKVSSPAAVQQNLTNAIQSSRAHDSSTLFSPPTQQTVKEQASYCDSTSAHNITFLADAANGTRIFISKTMSSSPTTFLSQNVSALNAFAMLLHEVAEVFVLPRKAIHIFYDETGAAIAFNSNGSIFCNFRFFAQLHQIRMASGTGESRAEAAAYWWVVLAHEVAHNLVKEHSSDHSFYT